MIAIGREYTPPAASVEYTDAISSGETPTEPSVSDGTASSVDERTPSLYAILTTRSGPTSRISRANTVLSEWTVAFSIDVAPR